MFNDVSNKLIKILVFILAYLTFSGFVYCF